MRTVFRLLLLISLLMLPLGCGGGGDEQGTGESPDVSSPEQLTEELPPPGEGGAP